MQAMATVPLVGGAASAQQTSQNQRDQTKKGQDRSQEKSDIVYSPENIGGGGRVERNFYRESVKNSKVPMVEGYSITDAATQEVHPWPEIGGNGAYLNFSGNVHMDAVLMEIPSGKALLQTQKFYEQLVYCVLGRSRAN